MTEDAKSCCIGLLIFGAVIGIVVVVLVTWVAGPGVAVWP
jgi:hypothetical protein